jgi:proliferating cell nuclear antigen
MSVCKENNPNYLFEIRTVKSGAIKTLIEALKEIIPQGGNFIFDSTGIKLLSMDPSHIILIHLKLEADNFEHYFCPNKQVIGVNMTNFFKLIKTMSSNNDTLTLFLEKDDENRLGIMIENATKQTKTIFKMNLLDLDEESIQIPSPSFNSVINIPSADFQKICRDMSNIAEFMEIKSISNQLIFNCSGVFATQETSILENNGSSSLSFVQNDDPNEIFQGVFSLKHLVLFTKCTNLCTSIELYLKNDYPLIVDYNVASLGSLKLCLAPKTNDI